MPEIPADKQTYSPEEIQDWQNVANTMHTWHPDLQAHTQRIIDERNIPVTPPNINEQSGRNINLPEDTEQDARVVTLDRSEIHPHDINPGCTEIVLQRHGQYIRDVNNPNAGSLTPEAVQLETESAEQYFSELLNKTPESEVDTLNILFVSSDTGYAGGGQRSYETTEIAQQVVEQLFQDRGIHLMNILNISPNSTNLGSPIAMSTLREPQMFDKTPEFVEYMSHKYGELGKDFWIAFEDDVERETRIEMGAEGPDELADRMNAALRVLGRFSQEFHSHNPNSRLIIWAGTHYDTISPYVKRDILHKQKSTPVLVDYGGGVVIDIDQSQQASATVGDNHFEVRL